MKKNSVFIIVLFVILLIAAIIVGFRDAITIRLFPKAILSTALRDSFIQLRSRFEYDPMILVLNTLDPDGKQTAVLDLDADHAYMGSVHYDLQLQTEPHFFLGEGTIHTSGTNLDLAFYADPNFMAVSSQNLVSGQYYGITYDSFLQDIQSIPLLTWLIGDPILNSWNEKVQNIQETMEAGYYVPYLPVLSADDLTKLTLFFITAPADVEKTTFSVNGEDLELHKISYSLNSPQITDLLCQILDLEPDESVHSEATFHVYKNKIVAAEIMGANSSTSRIIRLEMGLDISQDPIVAVLSTEKDQSRDEKKIRIETAAKSPVFRERWEFTSSNHNRLLINYEWSPSSGDMWLQINEGEATPLNFTGTEEGIRIESSNFVPLFRYLYPEQEKQLHNTVSGTVTFSRGNAISVPQYKNLSEWSLDDFLALLENIGSLIGIFP